MHRLTGSLDVPPMIRDSGGNGSSGSNVGRYENGTGTRTPTNRRLNRLSTEVSPAPVPPLPVPSSNTPGPPPRVTARPAAGHPPEIEVWKRGLDLEALERMCDALPTASPQDLADALRRSTDDVDAISVYLQERAGGVRAQASPALRTQQMASTRRS